MTHVNEWCLESDPCRLSECTDSHLKKKMVFESNGVPIKYTNNVAGVLCCFILIRIK